MSGYKEVNSNWDLDGSFDIAITDCFIAEEIVNLNPNYIKELTLISIWDKDTFAEEKFDWLKKVKNKLVIEFDDVLEPYDKDFCAPTIDCINKIIDFTSGISGRVLIHCAAGISRSSAAAMIALCNNGLTPKQAKSQLDLFVRKTKDKGWRDFHIKPNYLMLEYADTCLNLKGNLIFLYEDDT